MSRLYNEYALERWSKIGKSVNDVTRRTGQRYGPTNRICGHQCVEVWLPALDMIRLERKKDS